ncbi:MAG: hypothetical protein LBM13_05815, partial [Candidatus Ancillula sp.]|nr:hypothetical protein [Candidatus Ancillula sp.]
SIFLATPLEVELRLHSKKVKNHNRRIAEVEEELAAKADEQGVDLDTYKQAKLLPGHHLGMQATKRKK